ncbi:MAG: AI-2E family transporter [Anaerovoracaceae bacterium]
MLKAVILIVIFILIFLLRRALIPFGIGVVIAYILDPYVSFLEKKLSGKRLLCVMLAYITIIIAAALLILGFADIIAGKISGGSLQDALRTLQAYYLEYKDVLSDLLGFTVHSPDIARLLQTLGVGTVKLFIGMVAGIYLLKDKDYFLRLANKALHLLLGQKTHGILREILFDIDSVISSFLRGVFVDSVIVAFLSSLALSIIGIDFAVFIGCFAGLANVIPYFGPVIGIIPAALAGLAEGGIYKAILSAASLFAVQQIECNFIYPRIIGRSTGLHPLFVLTAVSVAGSFGGLLWMVLAVPIAGILRVLICKWAEKQ